MITTDYSTRASLEKKLSSAIFLVRSNDVKDIYSGTLLFPHPFGGNFRPVGSSGAFGLFLTVHNCFWSNPKKFYEPGVALCTLVFQGSGSL